MKGLRRDRLAAFATTPPLRTLLERLNPWSGVLVLNYHRVGEAEAQWDQTLWSASAEELDAQLASVARFAEAIAPEELLKALGAKRGRRVLITFDDGYRDNYEIAFPLLRRHGLRATFFLASGFLDRPHAAWWDEIAWMVTSVDGDLACAQGKGGFGDLLPPGISFAPANRAGSIAALVARYKTLPDSAGTRFLEQLAEATGSGRCGASDAESLWMTWDMAREMHAAGMSIGGHTVTHPVLARLSAERQREEIGGCAQRLRQELGLDMQWFAYPVGSRDAFTPLTQRILRESGVELAFSFYGGFARRSRFNPLDVPRVNIAPGHTPKLLEGMLLLPGLLARW